MRVIKMDPKRFVWVKGIYLFRCRAPLIFVAHLIQCAHKVQSTEI